LEAHAKQVKNKKPKDLFIEEEDEEGEENEEEETPNE